MKLIGALSESPPPNEPNPKKRYSLICICSPDFHTYFFLFFFPPPSHPVSPSLREDCSGRRIPLFLAGVFLQKWIWSQAESSFHRPWISIIHPSSRFSFCLFLPSLPPPFPIVPGILSSVGANPTLRLMDPFILDRIV